jgi:hypothetical protein
VSLVDTSESLVDTSESLVDTSGSLVDTSELGKTSVTLPAIIVYIIHIMYFGNLRAVLANEQMVTFPFSIKLQVEHSSHILHSEQYRTVFIIDH